MGPSFNSMRCAGPGPSYEGQTPLRGPEIVPRLLRTACSGSLGVSKSDLGSAVFWFQRASCFDAGFLKDAHPGCAGGV